MENPNQVHRALGWVMTTEGKSLAQFKVLKYKASIFAGAILQSHMRIYDTTTAYNCYYLSSIGVIPSPLLASLSTNAK
jgi:hypothetical protein